MPYGSELGGPFTVLHVDDDPALSALVRKALTRRGHTVVGVATGEDALARLAEGGIDVVALDHSLAVVPMSKKVSGFVQSPLGDFVFEGVDIAE